MQDEPKLLPLLRIAQDPDQPDARRVWARSQALRLVYGPVVGMVRKRLGGAPEVDDAISATILKVSESVDACRGTLAEDDEVGERQCWAWVFWTARGRMSEWIRRRNQEVPGREPVTGDEGGVETPEPVESLREQSLALAYAAYRRFVKTRLPEDALPEARELEAPMKLAYFEACADTWVKVRVRGTPTHDLGIALGFQGTRKIVQDRVSRMVKRGVVALAIGAGVAAGEATDEAVRTDLLDLKRRLLVPLKKRSKKGGGA